MARVIGDKSEAWCREVSEDVALLALSVIHEMLALV